MFKLFAVYTAVTCIIFSFVNSPINLTLLLCSIILMTLCGVAAGSTSLFLPLTLVIAYTGGILMLFLFVVILFEIGPDRRRNWRSVLPACVIMQFGGSSIPNILADYADADIMMLGTSTGSYIYWSNWDVLSITNLLYSSFMILFLASCWLLLIALLGAVTIAVRSTLLFATFWVPSDLTFIVVFLVVVLIVACLLVTIAYLLSKAYAPLYEKLSEYECGFEPFDNATKLPFDVHFYIIGVLFLIFDIEIVLMLPWVLKVEFDSSEFNVMVVFIVILLVGFIYEWYNGILQWPTRKFNTPQNEILKINNFGFIALTLQANSIETFVTNMRHHAGSSINDVLEPLSCINPLYIVGLVCLVPLLIKLISIIISVAYYTLAERKLMAAVQRRKGPNVVGIWGLLQPLADGGKLILKQIIIPVKAKAGIYLAAPVFIFVLSVTAWIVIPGLWR